MRLAAAYGVYFLGIGLFLPYFPVLLQERGYDSAAIGWMLALSPALRVVSPPAVGFIADRWRGAGFWGAMAAWLAAAGMAAVVFGPGVGTVVAGLALYSAATAPAIPLLDATLLRQVRLRGGPMGRIRLWGSIGFLLTSFGVGFFVPALPAGLIGIGLFGATVLFAVVLMLSRLDEARPERPRLAEVGEILRSPAILLLLVANFVNRVASAPYNAFYTIFVRDLGLGGDIVALNWGIAVAAEVLAMLVVDRLADRFGAPAVFAFGCALETARWFAHMVVRSPVGLLALSPLHGIAFCALFIGTVKCFAVLVPERLRATGQGLSTAASGLGAALGFALAGVGFERFGGAAVFGVAGLVGLVATAGALLLVRVPALAPRASER